MTTPLLGPVPRGSASLVDSATLGAWLGTSPPSNWQTLVDYAGSLVDYALRWGRYRHDLVTGLPTALEQQRAMVEAIAEQVKAWVALDVDPSGSAAATLPVISQATLGRGGSVTYAVGDLTAQQTVDDLVPAAKRALARAFTVSAVWVT